jgi:phosphoribulokinase
MRRLEQIIRREKIKPVSIEGHAFDRWNRADMPERMKEARPKAIAATATSAICSCNAGATRPQP